MFYMLHNIICIVNCNIPATEMCSSYFESNINKDKFTF